MLSLQMIVCVFSVIFTDGLNVEMFIKYVKITDGHYIFIIITDGHYKYFSYRWPLNML